MSRRATSWSSGAGEVCASDSNDAPSSKIIRNNQVTNGIKKSSIMDVFPWVQDFRSKCRSTLGCGTSTLIELIRTFNRNVNSNVSECYKNPSLAVRLKDLIKEYLLLFMHLYRYEQPQDQNREDYLEQMSDLLAVYVDLELVASALVAGMYHGEISARLVPYLCVCLDYSTEHVLDTLMKVQLAYANFPHILDGIISKLFELIPPKPQSAVMYTRYFLVYRLWKRINSTLVVKRPPPSAETLLGPIPANMPEFLLEQVLCWTPHAKPTALQPVEFYLQQYMDLPKACAQFLQYCRGRDALKAGPEDDIIERDKRLKSTSTSVPSKLSSVNTNFSKSSYSSVKSLSSSSTSNIPIVNSDTVKTARIAPAKSNTPLKIGGVEVIDLTSDEEPKPNGRKRPRRRLDWLTRAVQGIDAKIRVASQKRERELAPSAEDRRTEDASRRSAEEEVVRDTENPTERLGVQQIDDLRVRSLGPVDCRTDVKVEMEELVVEPVLEEAIRSSENMTRLHEEDRLSVVSVQEQPTDRSSSVERSVASSSGENQSHAEANEKDGADSGFSESDAPDTRNKQPEVIESEARSSFYDIQESDLDGLTLLACVLARQNATSNKSDKVLRLKDDERSDVGDTQEHPSVNASVAEKNNVSNVDENQCHMEHKPRSEEKEILVSNEVNEIDVPAIRSKQSDMNEPEARNSFYDIQESDLDGLTLLACVLARQSATSNKKAEIKVKPYASLQEKREPESRVVDRIVSICPEDALDKVALQVEVSSSEMIQSRPQPEVVSYVMEEPAQSSIETNDNANVILNGETVRLLQKSPNSNLYIINKAAVDNSKMNYNSDEEDGGKPVEPEETKCCPQSMMIKHEPDDVGLPRGRPIKPDPDHIGQPQPLDMLYPGHPPSSYCGYASKIHQSTAGCAYHNCVYCRQPPYYLSAQPVQTNSAVQEKRCMPTATEAELAKLYEEQLIKQQHPQLLEPAIDDSKIAVDKFNLTDSKLPLKKRLKVQRMSMGFVEQPSPAYPGTLMMSIADVELRPGHAALELGAEVEISAATAKVPKSRSGKEAKIKNQNMPDCFPRKNSGKKKKTEEEEPRKTLPKQTRSSRRSNVKYEYPEIDPEWNPSRKRKRKRSSR